MPVTPHQQKEAIKRRDQADETLADIPPQLQRQRGDYFEAHGVTRISECRAS